MAGTTQRSLQELATALRQHDQVLWLARTLGTFRGSAALPLLRERLSDIKNYRIGQEMYAAVERLENAIAK